MIELAALKDKNEIMSLIESAIRNMRKNNIDQWDEIYPDTGTIEKDLMEKSLYKYVDNGRIAAIIAINNQGPPEYKQIEWSDNSDNYLVVHRLTVHPDFQRRGIAGKMMRFCEEQAKRNKRSSIHLDTFTNNPIACNLYKRLGYIEKGTVNFRKGLFYCFEKIDLV